MSHVEFTKKMKKTHTILVPMMLPVISVPAQYFVQEGYRGNPENRGTQIIDEGLSVLNDTCYPACLYWPDDRCIEKRKIRYRTCAGNRRQEADAGLQLHPSSAQGTGSGGFEHVPVISVNFPAGKNNAQADSKMLLRLLYAFYTEIC